MKSKKKIKYHQVGDVNKRQTPNNLVTVEDIETKEILQKVESKITTQKTPSDKAKGEQISPLV